MKRQSKIVSGTPAWRLRPGLLWAFVLLAGIRGAASAQPYAYITNHSESGTIAVVDTATDTVVDSIPDVGNGGIVIHPDGTMAIVTDFRSSTLALLDLGTGKVVDRLAADGVGWLAMTPDGDRAYVTAGFLQPLSYLDIAKRVVVTSEVRPREGVFNHLKFAGRRGYVIDNQYMVQIFDVDADKTIDVLQADMIGVPDFVVFHAIAPTPDGAFLYAEDTYFGTAAKVDLRTHSQAAGWGGPMGESSRAMVLGPSGSRLYMTEYNSLEVRDNDSRAVYHIRLPDRPMAVALTPEEDRAYVTLVTNEVAVLDTASLSVVDVFLVPYGTFDIAIAPSNG